MFGVHSLKILDKKAKCWLLGHVRWWEKSLCEKLVVILSKKALRNLELSYIEIIHFMYWGDLQNEVDQIWIVDWLVYSSVAFRRKIAMKLWVFWVGTHWRFAISSSRIRIWAEYSLLAVSLKTWIQVGTGMVKWGWLFVCGPSQLGLGKLKERILSYFWPFSILCLWLKIHSYTIAPLLHLVDVHKSWNWTVRIRG